MDAQALRYIFLAEREAAHINMITTSKGISNKEQSPIYFDSYPGMSTYVSPALHPRQDWFVPKSTDPTIMGAGTATGTKSGVNSSELNISVVGVVGSGVMGSGIAASLLMGRYVLEVDVEVEVEVEVDCFCYDSNDL